ncbi:MAG: lytic transglycosylase domain-containing protein, partial [Actinomycetota bacterium]
QGLGQLHPEVTDFLHREVVDRRLDPTVAEDNIELTAAYLAFLLEFAEGDRAAALAGYWADSNAPGGGNWDLATAAFIRRVLASAPDFAASLAPAPTTTSTAP